MAEITQKQRKPRRMNPNSLKNLEGHQFKPGVCGNVNGRPKDPQPITGALRRFAEKLISTKFDPTKLTYAEASALKVWQGAVKGDQKALEFIADRTEGQSQAKVDITSKGEALGNGDEARAFITSRIASIAARGGAPGDNSRAN